MRTVHGFHGGIHPPENKRQSVRTPIGEAGIPPELVLPLAHHSGTPATPVVCVGETVLKGQKIAAATGGNSLPVHAPTSGFVRAIENRTTAHPLGLHAPCIVIAADGHDAWIDHSRIPDYRGLDSATLVRMIEDAGIAGMGGAGFPTSVKLSVPHAARITTLVINGAECEPYITCDDMLMRERAGDIIAGVAILQHILAPQETLIGVEDNKPGALAALRAAAAGSTIQIVEFPTIYPSGGENQLIEILTGRQVPAGTLPAHMGVLCLNVASAAATFDAVARGRPLISRVVTVTGAGIPEPRNFHALIGTPLRFLLAQAGFRKETNNRVILGGPLMGVTVTNLEMPVVKTTQCLLAPTESELPAAPPAQACIRCGLCAEVCPASLLPQQLFWFAQSKAYAKLETHNLFDCIECGACAYVCPSSIPLVQYYRASKAQILQLRDDRASAEASRLRFEARNRRLQRDALEQDAKRAARKLAAEQRARAIGPDVGTDDPIRAAVERAKARKAALHGPAGADRELVSREQAVASARKRLETASAKLAEAKAQGSDRAEAMQAAVDNTRAKLHAAHESLRDYRQRQRTVAPEELATDIALPVVDSFASASDAAATSGPRVEAHAELEQLQQLLQHSLESLARCRDSAEHQNVIIALEATVARLQRQIEIARQRLQTMRED
jgi:electron transport complex protein RnfC